MTSGPYVDHFLDSLENLPIELQRNFTLMRDLDTRAQSLIRNIDASAEEYLEGITVGSSVDVRKQQLSEIQKHFNKAKEYGDDKVQLAIQTYELVDKHIRRLDSDLQRFEDEFREKSANTIAGDEVVPPKRGRKKVKETKEISKRKGASSEDEGKRKKNRKGTGAKGGGKAAGVASITDSGSPSIAHPADVLDMPVDPNEPTYCLCHQVSYGEMIGCDNVECPIEWFHFACVGLVSKPKGKWFCPKCTADRKKK